jgi:hypothetical protein
MLDAPNAVGEMETEVIGVSVVVTVAKTGAGLTNDCGSEDANMILGRVTTGTTGDGRASIIVLL